jgi:general secretion pathway protein H
MPREPLLVHSLFPIPYSRPQTGFTLIEILVVVAIVGVLALALTLSVAASSDRQLEGAAERFSALLGHACEQAELRGRDIGVALGAGGYAFQRLDGETWQAFADNSELRARTWPAGLRIGVTREGRPLELASTEDEAAPQLVCFSSGELTPFVLDLALGDSHARYRVEGHGDGRLSTTRFEAAP